MSATTKDRAKAGTDAWFVDVKSGPDDSGNFEWHGTGEYPSDEAARAFAEPILIAYPAAYASIRRGSYVANEFDDDEYGTIYDADFVEDDNWFADGYLDVLGHVAWDISV